MPELLWLFAKRLETLKRVYTLWLRDSTLKHLEITERYFPKYVEELKGYAKGAGVDFYELWALNVEEPNTDRCTTITTNQGLPVSHNEDWEAEREQVISILQKTIGELTIFELYYYNTLGSCSASARNIPVKYATLLVS